jgi:hypothetical protein
MVHRLRLGQVQGYRPTAFHLHQGFSALPVQAPDGAGFAVRDPGLAHLELGPLRFHGLPILDLVAYGEPAFLKGGCLHPFEPLRVEAHRSPVAHLQLHGPPFGIHAHHPPLFPLADLVDLGRVRDPDMVPHLVGIHIPLFGAGPALGHPDFRLQTRPLHASGLNQLFPDQPVQVSPLRIARCHHQAGLPFRGPHVFLSYRPVPLGLAWDLPDLPFRFQPGHGFLGSVLGCVHHGGLQGLVQLSPDLVQPFRLEPRCLQVGERFPGLNGGMLEPVPHQNHLGARLPGLLQNAGGLLAGHQPRFVHNPKLFAILLRVPCGLPGKVFDPFRA